MSASPAVAIPDHVNPDVVFPFDYIVETNDVEDPFKVLEDLEARGAPEFFYTPHNGGHWVARSYDIIHSIFRDYEHFTTSPIVIPPIQGEARKLLPLEVNPPHHEKYRRILGPLFTPSAIRKLESNLRAIAQNLINGVADRGECEFVHEVAQRFPPHVFLILMGMPTDQLDEFIELAHTSISGAPAERSEAITKVSDFVNEFVAEKSKALSDDWTSVLIRAIGDDPSKDLSHEEVLDIAYFLFLAGLDTVLNSLVFAMRYFADHPNIWSQLRQDPEKIDEAVEEMLRLHMVVNNSRYVRADIKIGDNHLKKDDAVLMLTAVANRDSQMFENAKSVDFDREGNVHMTFGAGVHRCLGSNLARVELRVFLEEWMKQIPDFAIAPGATIRSTGGVTMGLTALPLVWKK